MSQHTLSIRDFRSYLSSTPTPDDYNDVEKELNAVLEEQRKVLRENQARHQREQQARAKSAQPTGARPGATNSSRPSSSYAKQSYWREEQSDSGESDEEDFFSSFYKQVMFSFLFIGL